MRWRLRRSSTLERLALPVSGKQRISDNRAVRSVFIRLIVCGSSSGLRPGAYGIRRRIKKNRYRYRVKKRCTFGLEVVFMKLISYNVNGIRAAMRKGLVGWLRACDADVVCFQEIKASEDQIDQGAFEALGYQSYWFPAAKKGYSGVGVLTRRTPNHVVYGCGICDEEGRVIRVDFDDCSVLSLYLPSGTSKARLEVKMRFCRAFLSYVQSLKKTFPALIVSGDYNICHRAIDIHDPIRNANVSGFLPEERQWLSRFLQQGDFVDSFRYFHPEPNHYSWWSYRANARAKNKGWRIDYHLVSHNLQHRMKRALILPEAQHADHCPISLELF